MRKGPFKHPDRAMQKVVRSYERDAASLTDLTRCSAIFNKMAHLRAFMQLLESMSFVGIEDMDALQTALLPQQAQAQAGADDERREHVGDSRIFRITRVKNRYAADYDVRETFGYRDLTLNLEVKSEYLQVNTYSLYLRETFGYRDLTLNLEVLFTSVVYWINDLI
jgi:hypothetical protein